ncbi:MAG: DUF488 family protein [Deltaproteobacteria bacterium]
MDGGYLPHETNTPAVGSRIQEVFNRRYCSELDTKSEVVTRLFEDAERGRLTLLYSARDAEYNQAVALRELGCGLKPRVP